MVDCDKDELQALKKAVIRTIKMWRKLWQQPRSQREYMTTWTRKKVVDENTVGLLHGCYLCNTLGDGDNDCETCPLYIAWEEDCYNHTEYQRWEGGQVGRCTLSLTEAEEFEKEVVDICQAWLVKNGFDAVPEEE